jgi:hypothetical protein
MITELEFVKGETRESALQKLAAWYDDQQHQAVIKFARDIEGAALSKQHKSDALEYACRSPSKAGAVSGARRAGARQGHRHG